MTVTHEPTKVGIQNFINMCDATTRGFGTRDILIDNIDDFKRGFDACLSLLKLYASGEYAPSMDTQVIWKGDDEQ